MIPVLNPGHGGFVGGKYTTAPDKMHDFGNGKVAYEGVYNRTIVDQIIKKLKQMGLPYLNLCPSNMDISLSTRLKTLQAYEKEYGSGNLLLLDMHSNAGGGTGFEIWTSKGQTKSDEYASLFGYIFKQKLPAIRFRADKSDGDIDKESNFYLITKSACAAILPEFMFFDNYDDWKILADPEMQDKYAEMVAGFCLQISTH